jgi:exopolysaccharide production protein ExoQ
MIIGMKALIAQNSTIVPARRLQFLSLSMLGTLWSALLIGVGFLYNTYQISVQIPAMEFSRQIGLPFLIIEIAVVLVAARKGFEIEVVWANLPSRIKSITVIFLATFWISSIFVSHIPLFSLAMCLATIIHVTFALALAYCLETVHDASLRRFSMICAAGMVAFALFIAYRFILHPPLSSMPGGVIVWQFAIPGFISVRLFGAVCGAVLTLLIGQLLVDAESGRIAKWQYYAVTFVGGMTMWSGTRAAVLGTFGALFITFLFYKLRPKASVFGLLVLSAIIATIMAILLVPYGDGAFMMYAPGDMASTDAITGGRLSIWAAAFKAFLTVPFFGAGSGATSWIMPAGIFPHIQPHNVVLQFLLGWGSIATLCALTLFAYAMQAAHQIASRVRVVLPVIAMLDCLLIMSFFDGILHFAQLTMMAMMCFAIIFAADRQHQVEPSSNS